MSTNSVVVNRFKVFFFHAVDLGHLIADDQDIHSLQELRAKDKLYEKLRSVFDSTNVTAFSFSNPRFETGGLESRSDAAISKGGKKIWADLFFRKQVPIKFATEQNLSISPLIPTTTGNTILFPGVNQTKNTGIIFEGCDFRIFREGTLSFTFRFSKDTEQPTIDVDEFISILDKLEAATFEGSLYRVKEIVHDWSKPTHRFQSLQIKLKPSTELDGILKSAFRKHSCIFADGFRNSATGQTISFDNEDNRYLIFGILNKSSWYKKYSTSYVNEAFNKNVGFRRDEIYLTDKDSSLVVLEDYWDPNKPLQFYMYDLMLAVEMQIAKVAYLNFILNNMQADPHSREALINPSGERAIQLVLQGRSVLTLAQESVDINSLIVHGFSRRFVSQVAEERSIFGYLDSIERRIENISNAISLKTSVDIGRQGLSSDRTAIRWAVVALVISASFSVINVILVVYTLYLHGNNVIQRLIDSLVK